MPLLNRSTKVKVCCKCRLPKRREAYSPDLSKSDGLATQCKACRAEHTKQYLHAKKSAPRDAQSAER